MGKYLLHGFRAVFAALILLPATVSAQGSSRCEWAACDPTPASTAASSKEQWTVSEAPRVLPAPQAVCTAADRNACAGECRREFDDRYHRCVDACLSTRCVRPTPSPTPGPATGIAAPCVEIESPVCVEDCKTQPESRRPRCRRDCLQRACPDSSPADVAAESLDPGTFRCERCRKRMEMTCARDCSLGVISGIAGIEQWGCQKACLIANCRNACGISFPF